MSTCWFALDTQQYPYKHTCNLAEKQRLWKTKISFCYLECYPWASLINQGQTLWSVKSFTKRILTGNLYQVAQKYTCQSIKTYWFFWPIGVLKPTSSHEQNNSCTRGIQVNLRLQEHSASNESRSHYFSMFSLSTGLFYSFLNKQISRGGHQHYSSTPT